MNYRVIVQAEGTSADGEWFGLYAAREVPAAGEAEAASRARAELAATWDDATCGPLAAVDAIAVWRAPMLSFKRGLVGGYSFYNDDADAQVEALRIEAEVSGLAKGVLRSVLDGLR